MDKAPDAFRTISEVADELDIPQHVLRFWETRFTQIKPMKRSGGRRFYRPEDVDLLRGIRRLLYADGYTIRGVQRILKEQGIKAVQGLDMSPRATQASEAEAPPPASKPAARRTPLPELEEETDEAAPEIEAEADQEPEDAEVDDTSIVVRPPLPRPFTTPLPSLELRRSSHTGMVPRSATQRDLVPLRTVPPAAHTPPSYLPDLTFETLMPAPRRVVRQEEEQRVAPELPRPPASFDVKLLRPVLDELLTVRRLLDVAMQNGEPGAP